VTRGPSNNLARYLQDESQWSISAVKELTIFVMAAETSVVFFDQGEGPTTIAAFRIDCGNPMVAPTEPVSP
jgi:hypothetical protein